MILKPPATPRPGIGEELRTLTTASLTRFLYSGSSRAMMSSACSPGALRLSNGSRTMNIEPKLEALAWSRNDIPEMVTVWATPGVSRVILSTNAMADLVRCSDAESGNWTLTISRPWSCWGMKPVGACWKTRYE